MTFRSLISFSLLAAEFTAILCASVSGTVELTGQRNASARKRKDYSGVVVWLEPLGGHAPLPVAARRAEMVQKDKKFSPHILAVPVGTQVDFPNFDPIFHNAFSSFSGQPFDVGLYPPGTSRSVTFKRDGVVRVFCNIHQTMSAIIVVLKTPWFAVTNAQGGFQIAGVPPGEYRLRVFDERAPADVLKSLERKVTVDSAGANTDLPPIAISEAGYLPAPHKNKYGADYPPASDDHTFYPGVKK
jgi:plastocyanin